MVSFFVVPTLLVHALPFLPFLFFSFCQSCKFVSVFWKDKMEKERNGIHVISLANTPKKIYLYPNFIVHTPPLFFIFPSSFHFPLPFFTEEGKIKEKKWFKTKLFFLLLLLFLLFDINHTFCFFDLIFGLTFIYCFVVFLWRSHQF